MVKMRETIEIIGKKETDKINSQPKEILVL